MPDNAGRDPAEVAKTLSAWLATKLPAGADPDVADVNAPAANGFSNETILCRATWTDDGQRTTRRLVVRVAPTVVRAYESGPEGLVLIAVGNDRPEGGDGEIVKDF